MKQVIIDEKSGNPFPARITIVDSLDMASPFSTEGYCHNNQLIKDTTKKLADIIGLTPAKRTIDVGYGVNLSVAETMNELGMDSCGLDSQDGLDNKRYQSSLIVPPHFNAEQNGVIKYCGTIEDILHPDSELKDEKFDLFIFWGSWEAGGYNFAIGGEIGDFRVREERPDLAEDLLRSRSSDLHNPAYECLYEAMQQNRDKILTNCKTALNPKGGILIVSSRYAGHGGGFVTEQLPWEKRINLRLAQYFADLGATEVYLFGISKNKTLEELNTAEARLEVNPDNTIKERTPDFTLLKKALTNDTFLFGLEREVYESIYPTEMVRKIKARNTPLGRIDAVYARF